MAIAEYFDIAMFAVACIFLMMGFPVAFTLAGVALIFALMGFATGHFDMAFIGNIPSRIFGGAVWNEVLIAVPLFVFMGVMLERSKVAEELLETMGRLFGTMRGGLGLSVSIVGALLAASTGIVGATVVTMGLMSLPTMMRRGYDPSLACGSICAAGTLGQIIPPSIVLVLLGDQISNAYVDAQRAVGNWSPEPVSVGDLFAGALLPGLMLVGMYMAYQMIYAFVKPNSCPPIPADPDASRGLAGQVMHALLPPVLLIVAVLGSILAGIATPTEAAAVGAVGAILLAGLRVQELDMERPLVDNAPSTEAVISRLAGAAIGGFILFMLAGDALFANPWISGIVGTVVGVLITAAHLFRKFMGGLDNGSNRPIYVAAASLAVMLFVSNFLDTIIMKDEIAVTDLIGIAICILATIGLAWGMLVALWRVWGAGILRLVNRGTMEISSMVFTILIGAAMFSLVFRGFGGDEAVQEFLLGLPGGEWGMIFMVMVVMFILGFFLDFIEITFVVVPIVAPILLQNDWVSPVWLGILMAMNLQTSFLTPPFGFALFYLRGVAPESITTMHIYKGVIPFVLIQIIALGILAMNPWLANYLPEAIFGTKFS
ncbi:TRAP transporter large permease [Aestuariispira insulae]|uniref:Tripartite ATP-independent transporter DctM subunit n=1 Tax=Aestuariispira insulae TaxID=1461337 RepID=A0A3D9HV60_9PROT|nr:TRAP transporter large permease subunit [Aestuariispira insulae]RED53404.1 tripartite ATP-independent transporter DctM subunit [Aestuariispira insulae]